MFRRLRLIAVGSITNQGGMTESKRLASRHLAITVNNLRFFNPKTVNLWNLFLNPEVEDEVRTHRTSKKLMSILSVMLHPGTGSLRLTSRSLEQKGGYEW